MALALNDEFSFSVVSKRPAASQAFTAADRIWCHDGYGLVRHCTTTPLGAAGLANILKTTPCELLLLNGFFDRQFTLPALIMRSVGIGPHLPAVLSPRGEFATAALAIGAAKKALYMLFVKKFGLLKDVWLHATAPHETEQILRSGIQCRGIIESPDTSLLHPLPAADQAGLHIEGNRALRIVHIARIVPMKNLLFVLRVLSQVTCQVRLDIYGPIGDADYWASCKSAISTLPPNVIVKYGGVVANDEIPNIIASSDLFFLPTLGENFGHAIHEALCSGVPVLISDKTPWRNLEENSAGWGIPLSSPSLFAERIMTLVEMDISQRLRHKEGARRYALKLHEECNAAERTAAMFRKVMETSP